MLGFILPLARTEPAGGIEKGDVSSATTWLTENIHQHGSVYEPADLIKKATGKNFTPEPFLNYLDEKFSDMYEV